ncbi:MAG: DUF2079 domain-containing protein [Gaiellaceae bacterium]
MSRNVPQPVARLEEVAASHVRESGRTSELERIAATASTEPSPASPVGETFSNVRIDHIVYATVLAWAMGFAGVAAVRQYLFLDRRYDLGNFTQAVWATAHGHFLEVTEVGGTQVSRLGIHVDPIIVVLAPLWQLWPSPVLLIVVQALGFAAGALPLFWLGRKYLSSEKDAAMIAGAYLLCPSVTSNALVEFHAVALAVPLLLFSIWFLDEGRLAFAAAAGGAMLCQEQIGLIVACLGLWYVGRTRKFVPGIAIAFMGLLVSALDFDVVLKHFSGGSPYAGRFTAVGASSAGLLDNLFSHPLTILGAVQPTDLVGLILVVPVLGLCLRSPLLFAAFPQVAILVLSDRVADWNFATQNVLPIIPFVYAGTVLALSSSTRRSRGRGPRIPARHVLAASIVIAISFWLSLGRPDLPSWSRVTAERHAVSLVPADAKVSTTNHLGSHLAARRYLYVFPVLRNADWVVIDSGDNNLPDVGHLQHRSGIGVGVHDLYWQPRLMQRELKKLERSPQWKLVYRRSNVYVFARKAPYRIAPISRES